MTKGLLNRRSLLVGGAGIPLVGGFAARADSSRKVRSLLAEGIAQADTVVGPAPLQLPPTILAALQAGGQLRIRLVYPEGHRIATFFGFLAGPADPPPPLASLEVNDPRVFTVLQFEIEREEVSFFPQPNFLLTGRLAAEVVPSPFFQGLTGRLAGITGGFAGEGNTTFSMLGGFVAGSHASYARTAAGRIEL
jgi:hypothetical protein